MTQFASSPSRPTGNERSPGTGVRLVGTVSWPGFGKHGEDWFGFVFRIESFTGTPLTGNAEGALEWVEVDRVPALPLWEGDRFFLPLVFDPASPQFHGVMPYRDGRPISWNYSTTNSPAATDRG